ncbi:MAG: hypothetical protein NHG14_00375 [Candidatus Shikimatogenerans bostrichidophilus]|nr:MAG: hypothetical protein NHG14_00375 [Candidatus Shikimatogenerans bostrichidophilus]
MYKKYIIKYNCTAGTNKINILIKRYIYYLYKYRNDKLFFLKILIILFDRQIKFKLLNKIIKTLYKIIKIYNNNNPFIKYLHKKFLISYINIRIISKKILKNIINNYDKIPIYYIDNFFFNLYKQNYFKYINLNNLIKNKNIYTFLNYIFKNKNINNKFIKKFFLKKIFLGHYKIINYLKSKVKLVIKSNKILKKESVNYIYNKINYYINKKKKIKFQLLKIKEKFFIFLKKKGINSKDFIYNDIYIYFNKKINVSLMKNVYLKKTLLNNRLKKNLNNNLFVSKQKNNLIKNNINKNKNKIKKIIYKYDKLIIKSIIPYIISNKLLECFIIKLYIVKTIKTYPRNFILYNKYISKRFINYIYKYKKIFIYDYQDIPFNKWILLKKIFNNFIYIGNKIYLWGNIKKMISPLGYYNLFTKIKYKKYKRNIILEKFVRTNIKNNYFLVLFYNNLFTFIKDRYITEKDFKSVYNNSGIEKIPNRNKNNGYIEINILNYKKNIFLQILNRIKNLLNNNYNNTDIIILLRNSIEANDYVLKLNKYNNNYNILSDIVFKNIIYLNDIIYIKIIIFLLKSLIYSKFLKYRIKFIILLNKIKKKKIDFNKKIFKNNIYYFIYFLKKNNIKISYIFFLNLNLYDKIQYLINRLNFNSSIFYKFLEIVYLFTKKSNNIYEFIKYWSTQKFLLRNIESNNIIRVLSLNNNNKNINYKILILPFLSWNIFYNPNKIFNDIIVFKNIYNETSLNYLIEKKQLDNFNLLYSLITIAKNKLIIYLKKTKNKYNIYHLFQSFLKNLNTWKKKSNKYTFGVGYNYNINTFKDKNRIKKKNVKEYIVNFKKKHIVYNNFFLIKKKNTLNKINKRDIKYFLLKVLKTNKFNIIKKDFFFNKKVIKINNLIYIKKKLYIIKIIKNKRYNIYKIFNNIIPNLLILKNIYKYKYKLYTIIVIIINKKKIKYIYKFFY